MALLSPQKCQQTKECSWDGFLWLAAPLLTNTRRPERSQSQTFILSWLVVWQSILQYNIVQSILHMVNKDNNHIKETKNTGMFIFFAIVRLLQLC